MNTNQEERELLELAAKACGFIIDEHARNGSAWAWVYRKDAVKDEDGEFPVFKWNPRHDDGDCARMEAALEIDIEWWAIKVWAADSNSSSPRQCFVNYSDHNGDKQAARRLASLRVAAEIGRAMK